MKSAFLSVLLAALPAWAMGADSWRSKVQQELPLLGHRNWIAIVDSAYPLQVSPGVETVETGASQIEVLKAVLSELSISEHVRPVVFQDAELQFLTDQQVPGVMAYRKQLAQALESFKPQPMLHQKLIDTTKEVGASFHILVLKTNLALPYTSVFLRLDCKYWSDSNEEQLRTAMKDYVPPAP